MVVSEKKVVLLVSFQIVKDGPGVALDGSKGPSILKGPQLPFLFPDQKVAIW